MKILNNRYISSLCLSFLVLTYPFSYATAGTVTHGIRVQAEVWEGPSEECIYVGADTYSTGTYYNSPTYIDRKCSGCWTPAVNPTTCGKALIAGTETHKLYFSAKELSDWLFLGWYTSKDDAALVSSDYNTTRDFSTEGATANAADNMRYLYARWVQPKVTGITAITGFPATIINPNTTATGSITFSLLDDRSNDNFTPSIVENEQGNCTITTPENYVKNSYTLGVQFTPTGIHGQKSTAKIRLTSKYGGTNRETTVSVKEDYTPKFTITSLYVDFSGIEAGTTSDKKVIKPTPSVYASQSGYPTTKWTKPVQKSGETEIFTIESFNDKTGECSFLFKPLEAKDYSATFTFKCTYTGYGNNVSDSVTITLRGTGTPISTPQLTISNSSSNLGSYNSSTRKYTYLEQYGTATKSAEFTLNYALLQSAPTLTLTDGNGVFQISTGESTTNAVGLSTLPLNITAHVDNAVTTTTKYNATLTVSGTTTSGTPIEQTLDLEVTISPKKESRFEWALRQYGTSFYYIFTDDGTMPIVTNITNTTTPFQISGSTAFANYVTIDDVNMTVTPKPNAHHNSDLTLTVTQPESDEYLGYSLTAKFRVRKHDAALIYHQVDPMRGNGTRLYRNTHYDKLLTTASIEARETTASPAMTYLDSPIPAYGQTLIPNSDGTCGMETGDLVSSGSRHVYIKVPEIAETENHYKLAANNIPFVIIKDPIHVPTGPGSLYKFTSGAHMGEYYGLWLNNAYDMYGSTFKVSDDKATWIGYDWEKNASGVYEWTGTNTGKKDWAVDTKGNTTGSTNAFALEDGGSVVFHFRGVPMYTSFGMYFQTATSDGTVTVAESADGNTWTPCTNNSTSATYLSTPGGKGVWMKGDSRYIRFSYSGSNHVAIINTTIYENTYIRTNFTTNNLDKQHVSSSTYNELHKNSDGNWGTFDFTLKVANWGKNGIQYSIDNSDFALVIDNDSYLTSHTGLDEYKELSAHIKYKGNKLVDKATIKLSTRDFYSKTAADTLRSLTFTVNAVGIGADLPESITNDTKNTTYMTGTVGPYLNTATQLEETSYLYSQTRGDNPHTGLSENDFSACFGTDGTPLFDSLYIFGTTTNTDNATHKYAYYYKDSEGNVQSASGTFPKISAAAATAPCNAITPCYVYKKEDDRYTRTRTIANMNVAKKPIGTITASGQKIYFSGFCPSISTGYQASDMGAIHVTGGKDATIDIYLDNCQLIARTKSKRGYSAADTVKYRTDAMDKFIEGSGAALVLQPTNSKAFNANIHLKGTNYLKSTQGNHIWVYVNLYVKKINAHAAQSSSPIHVYPGNTSNKCNLTFDDNWATNVSTNGSLKLRRSTNQTPSIDLGNENTSVTFNGGQYNLQNAIPSSDQYISSMALSWRSYSISYATMYGLGADETTCGGIYFNDGTFSTLPMNMNSDDPYYGFYRDKVSIKCPQGVRVNGGSYNALVWEANGPKDVGASPFNSASPSRQCYPYRVKVEKNAIDPVTGLCTLDDIDGIEDDKLSKGARDYYKNPYNHKSLTPDKNDSVTLMLPAELLGETPYASKTVTPWVLVSTPITVTAGTDKITIGGEQKVPYDVQTEQTNFILWTNIDQNIKTAAKSYSTPAMGNISASATISMSSSKLYANVSNEADYQVRLKLYYMTTVMADRWMSFCAPFDISNVYVFDTYPSQALEEMTRSEALAIQGTSNLDLAYAIGSSVDGTGNSIRDLSSFVGIFWKYGYGQDTTSGHYPKNANIDSKTGKPYYPKNYTSAKGYTKEYRTQTPLVAYNGKNANSAHYFLYHSRDKEWAYDGKAFKTDWELVTPVTKVIGEDERTVLMQQGEIYAMQFPYCSGCDDPATRPYYDYWTGKFILFEGYGPQTLRGTNAHSSLTAAYNTPNMGSLRGNLTLADVTANNSNTYRQADGQNKFEASKGTVMPGGVFMLANGAARAGKIAQVDVFSGDVTYSDEEGATGLQTLARDHTLLVGTTEHQLIITALRPQQVAVYSASGQLIAQQYLDGELRLYLPQGMYLVRGEKDETKAVVR